MKKIFVIDNYDSFTYNLVHYLEELGAEVTVRRNDQFELSEPEAYEYLLLSPSEDLDDDNDGLSVQFGFRIVIMGIRYQRS